MEPSPDRPQGSRLTPSPWATFCSPLRGSVRKIIFLNSIDGYTFPLLGICSIRLSGRMDNSNPRFEIKRNGLIRVFFPRSLCRCSLERIRTLAHLFRIEFSNARVALASDDVRKAATEFLLSECETARSIRLRLWEKQDVFRRRFAESRRYKLQAKNFRICPTPRD